MRGALFVFIFSKTLKPEIEWNCERDEISDQYTYKVEEIW